MEKPNYELHGVDAIEYTKRLRKIKSNPDTWEIEYIDDSTGEKWLMDYPESEYHGGGSPRLRKLV
ncbi:Imm27 family immunity protein [Methylocaldum gracile]|jgi:hypothetical protein|uniref:Imm27 family immunity protein n=1 Tax=unclassified Methylocaldum TaxID=2622260 RepID=UPI00105F45B7